MDYLYSLDRCHELQLGVLRYEHGTNFGGPGPLFARENVSGSLEQLPAWMARGAAGALGDRARAVWEVLSRADPGALPPRLRAVLAGAGVGPDPGVSVRLTLFSTGHVAVFVSEQRPGLGHLPLWQGLFNPDGSRPPKLRDHEAEALRRALPHLPERPEALLLLRGLARALRWLEGGDALDGWGTPQPPLEPSQRERLRPVVEQAVLEWQGDLLAWLEDGRPRWRWLEAALLDPAKPASPRA